jgi:hypothetical protein
MSENRDRAMKLELDESLGKVLDFMQGHLERHKLVPVARAVASLAPILWEDDLNLENKGLLSLMPESFHGQLSVATQSALASPSAGDDFGAAMDNQKLT